MKTIRNLCLSFKAWVGTLSIKQFEFMCLEFDRSGGRKFRSSLSKYLSSRRTPSTDEINAIYGGSCELQWLYLAQMTSRKLSEYEESRLVTAMPMGGDYRFPQELKEREALQQLFSFKNVTKLAIYLHDYLVPEEYELKLLDFCKKIHSTKLLENYLEYKEGYEKNYPFFGEKAQNAFLEIASDELLEKWFNNYFSFEKNFLTEESIKSIIVRNSRQVMSTYLLNTYLPTKEFQRKVLEKYPELKWQLEISKLRRPLLLIEWQKSLGLAVDMPTEDEIVFMEDTLDTIDSLQDKQLYEKERLNYRLQTASPALCAWIAREFPALEQKAYQHVRRIAEMYK